MAFNNLPPQAYTRDTLIAAYDWLQSQPASVRELAVGPDALVSLFMQSRRRPTAHVSTPPQNNKAVGPENASHFPISVQAPMTSASAEAFKQDLKSLAADLKQFDDVKMAPPAAIAPTAPTPSLAENITPPTPTLAAPVIRTTAAPRIETESSTAQLDARTRQVLAEVKQKLNVSTESEALRLLIAIGYEKIRDILPKN